MIRFSTYFDLGLSYLILEQNFEIPSIFQYILEAYEPCFFGYVNVILSVLCFSCQDLSKDTKYDKTEQLIRFGFVICIIE